MPNVLLTSAGRRSYLVQYFQEALAGTGKVVVANTHLDVAAAQCADVAVQVPASWDAEYVPHIQRICQQHSIQLLCSLHDLDTYFLAPHAPALQDQGVVPMLPSPDWARICLDKLEASRQLQAHGFEVPWTDNSLSRAETALERGEIQFPLLIKARHGFGSLGLVRCRTLHELRWQFEETQRHLEQLNIFEFLPGGANDGVLIQEFVEGEEFCVDVVNDLRGTYAAHFVGLVHGMRAGETDSLTTVSPDMVGELPRRLSQLTRHMGIWGLDLLSHRNRMFVIDINPRFTGDYPFQHLAGANVPAALLHWVEGRTPDPSWLRPALNARGYKDLVPRRAA